MFVSMATVLLLFFFFFFFLFVSSRKTLRHRPCFPETYHARCLPPPPLSQDKCTSYEDDDDDDDEEEEEESMRTTGFEELRVASTVPTSTVWSALSPKDLHSEESQQGFD
ncbi:hypothetical protein F2P81_015397 [Scophthalmus maximus]|uniref:Secreted protein n=1 Tax=Scophthalmus maximus TaxID=52904 RepID=A0A6A4SIN2_SCOMX|nr:hypothetical protein F2P81_015397 [Scophthalmus maximus]